MRFSGHGHSFDGASIDSRTLRPGQLFVPIVGERDGHDFVPAALEAGAAAYLTSRAPVGGPAIVVEDTLEALTDLGRQARERLTDRVVGITGSVGKTSVKDMAAAAIEGAWSVWASERSFNNELGVPLTLVNAPEDCDVLVIEMGARGVGHIRELCGIARPSVGVVTDVGLVHSELFGSLDAVIEAKGELVESLPPSGTAVLNADRPPVIGMAERTRASVLSFGVDGGDVRAESVTLDDELRPTFVLRSPWGAADVRLAARGAHNVVNALAAASAALAVDTPLDTVASGLGTATLSPWRMELQRSPSGVLVLNDAYNANPMSMEVALRSLVSLPGERRIAVLGLMAELGEEGLDEHERIGRLAAELGVEVISVGVPEYGGHLVADAEDAFALLDGVGAGDVVLLKASRVAGLERLAERLLVR